MSYMNGTANGGSPVLVLYKVSNYESDDGLFNAFYMPRGLSTTLASVKQSCAALRSLNHIGPDGYHWRVLVEDKPAPQAPVNTRTFSWWDIQDENANLPVKETSPSDLQRLFMPKTATMESDSDPFRPKNALKTLGKAMNAVAVNVVAGHTDSTPSGDYGPPVRFIAFKLLDMIKAHDDVTRKGGSRPESQASAPRSRPTVSHPAPMAPAPVRNQQQPLPVRSSVPPPRQQAMPSHQARQVPTSQPQAPQPPRRQAATEPSLMSFDSPAVGHNRKTFHHAASLPSNFNSGPINPNETRAERLKREYASKNRTANRVWDDVDQRWVEVDATADVKRGTTAAPPSSFNTSAPQKKTVGIKLDPSNAVGKSAAVQAAVHQRVSEMRESQAKALKEVREREQKKKVSEAEEDAVRKKLEPKIKAWSEEHGKKKQLRALLGSLHTILWPEAEWKPVNIGDILDDAKCKRCFHKASRVVHPDKTHHLDAEKRFLAKRIFDALSQAKTEFDG